MGTVLVWTFSLPTTNLQRTMPSITSNIEVTEVTEDNGDFFVSVTARTDPKALRILEWVSMRDYVDILDIERMKAEHESHSYGGAYIELSFDRELEAKVFINVFDPEHGDFIEMSI